MKGLYFFTIFSDEIEVISGSSIPLLLRKRHGTSVIPRSRPTCVWFLALTPQCNNISSPGRKKARPSLCLSPSSHVCFAAPVGSLIRHMTGSSLSPLMQSPAHSIHSVSACCIQQSDLLILYEVWVIQSCPFCHPFIHLFIEHPLHARYSADTEERAVSNT